MSTTADPGLYIGKRENFRKVITESEAIIYTGLVGENHALKVEGTKESQSDSEKLRVQHLLMVGIVGGLLNACIPGQESQCVNIHFEFLAPIFVGDIIETTIELIDLNTVKNLATFKADCFNQNKNQVITGRAVMLVQL